VHVLLLYVVRVVVELRTLTLEQAILADKLLEALEGVCKISRQILVENELALPLSLDEVAREQGRSLL